MIHIPNGSANKTRNRVLAAWNLSINLFHVERQDTREQHYLFWHIWHHGTHPWCISHLMLNNSIYLLVHIVESWLLWWRPHTIIVTPYKWYKCVVEGTYNFLNWNTLWIYFKHSDILFWWSWKFWDFYFSLEKNFF